MERKFLMRGLFAVLLVAVLAMAGCSGNDGHDGKSAYEIAVDNGFVGTEQEWLDSLGGSSPTAQAANVEPESCATCHNGTVVRSGVSHQDAYAELFQQGVIEVTNVAYSNDNTLGEDTVTFEMTKNGLDFDCTMADSLNIRYAQYTGVDNAEFISIDGTNDLLSLKGTVTYDAGTNTCTSVNAQTDLFDLSALNGVIAVYGQDELVSTGPSGSHLQLAKYPFAALDKIEGAGAWSYTSAANATGCEKCHQVPYYKHGYILGDVSGAGTQDFWTCKVCHVDNRDGGHEDWQYMVDDPQGWATGAAATADYSYKTRLMNDVHMSHAMEFPYPQSMRTCATCHAGKLTETLSESNMTLETCKSCHPVTGGTDLADSEGDFAYDTTGIALENLIPHSFDDTTVCADCHKVGGIAPLFSEIHTGYDPEIYDEATGTKYADAVTVSIDSVTLTGTALTVEFSAASTLAAIDPATIEPTVYVAAYGYDTKDFIISNHSRDADRNRLGEFTLDGTSTSPYFSNPVINGDGTWAVTFDTTAYDADGLITDGVITRLEVAIAPSLDVDGQTVGLNSPSVTFDLDANATEDNYFKGTNALVSVTGDTTIDPNYAGTKGCNACHDQLATSFHSGNRGGNIVVCRMCHVVTSGGSHLEGQSRSIDSYVHAIHRFQAFDIDNIDFTDPVEAAHYEEHIGFLFPDFATINCEACHTTDRDGDNGLRAAYDVPDQSKSMPGLLSATDEVPGMAIGGDPSVVVGPAARACGACHRAQFIKEDDAGGFASFNQHTKEFGYRIEETGGILDTVIENIMSMFQ